MGERATTSNQIGFDVYADNLGWGVATGEVYRGATGAAADIDDSLVAKRETGRDSVDFFATSW